MRKVTTSSEPAALIRRRDIAAVASIGGVVLLVLAFSGGLEIAAAIVGTATIAAIATIYYLAGQFDIHLLHLAQNTPAGGIAKGAIARP